MEYLANGADDAGALSLPTPVKPGNNEIRHCPDVVPGKNRDGGLKGSVTYYGNNTPVGLKQGP